MNLTRTVFLAALVTSSFAFADSTPKLGSADAKPGFVVAVSPGSLIGGTVAGDFEFAVTDAWSGYVGVGFRPQLYTLPLAFELALGARVYGGSQRFDGLFLDVHGVANSPLFVNGVIGGGVAAGWSFALGDRLRLSFGVGADVGIPTGNQYALLSLGPVTVVPRLRGTFGWTY